MPDDNALGGKLVGQVEDAVECREEGLDFGDLRADMAVDAFNAQGGQLPGLPIGRQRAVVGDAELVVAQAGRDIGMSAGIDIGVDPQRDRGRKAEGPGDRIELHQLALGLDIEAAHAGGQGLAHLLAAFANSGEDDLRGIATGGQHPRQFAPRDDVETGTVACEQVKDRQIAVGFDRKTHQSAAPLCGLRELAPGRFDRRTRIDPGGSAEALGDIGQCHALGMEGVAAQGEGGQVCDGGHGRAGGAVEVAGDAGVRAVAGLGGTIRGGGSAGIRGM